MSNCISRFSLPFLHKELDLGDNEAIILPYNMDTVKHIWPGLPHMPEDNYWSAPNYVFDPINAEYCKKNLDTLGEMAMTGVPIHSLVAMDLDAKNRKERRELNDLKAFAHAGVGTEREKESENSVLVSAQKMLLWVWLLEEKVLEMRDLMHNYKNKSTSTIDPLFVEEQEDMNTLLNMEYQLEESSEPLPSWKIVLENAAVFLPNESIIFVSCKQMIGDLQEVFNFQKCSDSILKLCPENLDNTYNIEQAESFVWQALGLRGDAHKHFGLNKLFTFVILRGKNEAISD